MTFLSLIKIFNSHFILNLNNNQKIKNDEKWNQTKPQISSPNDPIWNNGIYGVKPLPPIVASN